MPKVSIVMPTYKRTWKFLGRALNSLRGQTYKDIEIIVIDDSPSDYAGRQDIIDRMAEVCRQDIRVKYLINEKNLGGSLARNRGIAAATGEYITFLDDDDEYLPMKVEHQLQFMLEQDCDMSYENRIMYDTNNKIIDVRDKSDITAFDNDTLLRYHLTKQIVGTTTFMYKTDKLREIDGFVDAKMGQEFFLMLKTIEKGLKIRYLNICDTKTYIHQEGRISDGKNKIDGENRLYEFKRTYFSRLTPSERKFISFRHYAVLTVVYKRNHQYLHACVAAVQAFLASPYDFFIQVPAHVQRIMDKRKNNL